MIKRFRNGIISIQRILLFRIYNIFLYGIFFLPDSLLCVSHTFVIYWGWILPQLFLFILSGPFWSKKVLLLMFVFLIHSTSLKKNCLTFEDNVFLIHLWFIEVECCLNCFFLFCLALFGQKKVLLLLCFFLKIHSTSFLKKMSYFWR